MTRTPAFVAMALALVVPGWGESGLAAAQDAPDPTGHWKGAIVTPMGDLEFDVDLWQEDGRWSGDVTVPTQEYRDTPLSDVVVKGRKISFRMPEVEGEPTWEGTLSEDGLAITGTFTQAGESLEFHLKKVVEGG